LGFDSCAIFYIGGNAAIKLAWGLDHLPLLTAVADEMDSDELHPHAWMLHRYSGTNHPGQHWACYRSQAFNEAIRDKNLRDRLVDLLTPSTTPQDLDRIEATGHYCPYLRLKQKPMDRGDWLVDEAIHNGAHFPLCVFTNNARARSKAKALHRAMRNRAMHRHNVWAAGASRGPAVAEGVAAVAGCGAAVAEGKGKGKGKGQGKGYPHW